MVAELAKVAEVWLRPPGDKNHRYERPAAGGEHPVLIEFDRRPDLRGLPVLRGDACRALPSLTGLLMSDARLLRETFGRLRSEPAVRSAPGRTEREREPLGLTAANAGLMRQMLQCESKPLRAFLIDTLRAVGGPSAARALAAQAVFDPEPAFRQSAALALLGRPAEEYRPVLIDAFRHPWPRAAAHAAEALLAANDVGAVKDLVELLDAPDPSGPAPGLGGVPAVREVVRVNHARNCQLCHAPSRDRPDSARVKVPSPDEPLPPSFPPPAAQVQRYYGQPEPAAASPEPESAGPFVRADITYLRQDFSLMLPVENPGPWPKLQRFDFLVRTRPATDGERTSQQPADYPQRAAIMWVLREFTGHSFNSADSWRHYIRSFLRAR
jgi:hypothetical protein